MRQLASILIAALAAASYPVVGQDKSDAHSAHHPAAAASAEMASGEVRRIAKDTNKITLRHGEIKSLDMPPMTMVFNVRDPKLLDQVKVGDKVQFAVEKAPDGAFVVTEIKPAQ